MIKTHKNKIILLTIFSLLTSEFLTCVFNNIKDLEKSNLVSRTQLCYCSTGTNMCLDCCCAKDFGENDNRHETGVFKDSNDTGKHLIVITSCGGSSDHTSFSPELNYIVSLSPIIYYLPFTTTLEPITLRPTSSPLLPPYEPPRA